ncbi:putative membrane protein YccC [Inquilinus ginsengisoli]|uniref:Membrane protein YccC n=1 Tax=Inquilinus ginsengisoli TaxID=363840 RepID=A0ABU1JQY5_9PROT|nr:FUSC family protein [Inquilinus ginsengisoli]MDR6289954.1 putative membrane protein YccC [Inquilinus ginsengisoli]
MAVTQAAPGRSPLLAALVQWNRATIPWPVALRNALAVALPVVLGVLLGQTDVGLAVAGGALNVVSSDAPGPHALRLRRMLLISLGAGLAALTGFSLGTHWLMLLPVLAIWAFVLALLVALGPVATQGGTAVLIVLVVTSGTAGHGFDPWAASGLFLAGGLLATLFSVAGWPLRIYQPERDALSAMYRMLSEIARAMPEDTVFMPLADSVADAQQLLGRSNAARIRGVEAFRVLLGLAERIRLELLALSDLRGQIDDPALPALMRQAAVVLRGLAMALRQGRPMAEGEAVLKGFETALAALRTARHATQDPALRRRLHLAEARAIGLAGTLRAAIRNTAEAGSRGDRRATERDARQPAAMRPGAPLAILRANLSLSSVAFRHALRCMVCVVAAEALGRAIGLPQYYWIAMTVVIVLKPDFGGTVSFGLLRMFGTLAGLLLATGLAHLVFAHPLAQALLVGPLYFAFRYLVPVHYGLAVSLLTAVVVLLLGLAGLPAGVSVLDRGVATVLGSLLGLAAYLLWPTWERRRERPVIAAMIDAYAAYLTALLAGDARAQADARDAARGARVNAQATVDRLRVEPADPGQPARAEAIFANANRILRAGMALESALHDHGAAALAKHAAIEPFGRAIAAALAELAAALREQRPAAIPFDLPARHRALADLLDPAALPETDQPVILALLEATDRMVDATEALAGVIGRVPPEAEEAREAGQGA